MPCSFCQVDNIASLTLQKDIPFVNNPALGGWIIQYCSPQTSQIDINWVGVNYCISCGHKIQVTHEVSSILDPNCKLELPPEILRSNTLADIDAAISKSKNLVKTHLAQWSAPKDQTRKYLYCRHKGTDSLFVFEISKNKGVLTHRFSSTSIPQTALSSRCSCSLFRNELLDPTSPFWTTNNNDEYLLLYVDTQGAILRVKTFTGKFCPSCGGIHIKHPKAQPFYEEIEHFQNSKLRSSLELLNYSTLSQVYHQDAVACFAVSEANVCQYSFEGTLIIAIVERHQNEHFRIGLAKGIPPSNWGDFEIILS